MKHNRIKGGIEIRKLYIILLIAILSTTGCNQQEPIGHEENNPQSTEEATLNTDIFEPLEPLKISEQDLDLSIRDGVWENAVVASAHPLASLIGVRILKKGGNAVDAAVGTSFALGLLEPNASGPGGGGYMTIKMTDEDPVFLDYRCVSPSNVDTELYQAMSEYDRNNGIYSIAVPGAIDGWLKAHERFGSLALDVILEDVIVLAEEGFPVDEHLEGILIDNYGKFLSDEAASKLFLNEGIPYSKDEVMTNEAYANFIKTLIQEGRDGFYNGIIAKNILKTMADKKGWIDDKDLQEYETIVRQPLMGSYREYQIITSAPSSSGGVAIIESLNMLEKFDLSELSLEDSKRVDLLARIFRLVNIDRYTYVGDSSSSNENVINTLISKEYAQDRVNDISDEVLGDIAPGIIHKESESTTHFSIIDQKGNAVAVTNTLGYYFGSGVVLEDYGFFLNNQMYDFDSAENDMNGVEGKKRPRSSMAPTIVTKNNEIILVLGSPGGQSIPGNIVQVLINVIDLEMNLSDAIKAPRFSINFDKNLFLEEAYQINAISCLEDKGYLIDKTKHIGSVQGIYKHSDGLYEGVSDFRRGGKPSGY